MQRDAIRHSSFYGNREPVLDNSLLMDDREQNYATHFLISTVLRRKNIPEEMDGGVTASFMNK
jgi:hypothetical protein